MSARGRADEIYVEAPARLHFGVLDLRGALGRWFGGIGTAAPAPTLLVSASVAETLEATGDDAERAAAFARRFLAHHQLTDGVRVRVHRTLPPHVGLGSGTQLGLAVGRALGELLGVSMNTPDLARAVGRTSRSAIGTWIFDDGGLVVEGGHRAGTFGVAPLLARLPFPPDWHCVVAVPHSGCGMSGVEEADAFARLPSPAVDEVERVAHLVLMGLLPALAEGDLETFGSALTEIQTITGDWFAATQGGTFASGPSQELVRQMHDWGIPGAGQSSWGPTVYGIVATREEGHRLAERLRKLLGPDGTVYGGPFRTEGARVWRNRADASPR